MPSNSQHRYSHLFRLLQLKTMQTRLVVYLTSVKQVVHCISFCSLWHHTAASVRPVPRYHNVDNNQHDDRDNHETQHDGFPFNFSFTLMDAAIWVASRTEGLAVIGLATETNLLNAPNKNLTSRRIFSCVTIDALNLSSSQI